MISLIHSIENSKHQPEYGHQKTAGPDRRATERVASLGIDMTLARPENEPSGSNPETCKTSDIFILPAIGQKSDPDSWHRQGRDQRMRQCPIA